MSAPDTIVAIATPLRPSAAAVVRASGPACEMLCRVLCGGEFLPRKPFDCVLHLHIGDVPARVWMFRAPASATGDDVLELRLPGQPLIASSVVQRLLDLGCREAQPGEFTLRALKAGKLDLSRAQGVLALISAQDEAGRLAALRDLSGEAAARARGMADRLRELGARYELSFDFAEDEPEAPDNADLRRQARALGAELAAEAGGPPREASNRRPRVALFGPPNAGKSSLFNALLGAPRSLVSTQPGTTRDAVTMTERFGGVELELADLSGVGALDADVGRFAANARNHALSADLLLLVCAPGQADELGAEFARICAQDAGMRARALWVGSMCDIAPPAANPARLEQIDVSALSGGGLDSLRAAISTRLREAAVPPSYLRRQLAEAAAALMAIADDAAAPPEAVAGAVRKALRLVDEALFSDAPGDVLDLIFSRFCIGK